MDDFDKNFTTAWHLKNYLQGAYPLCALACLVVSESKEGSASVAWGVVHVVKNAAGVIG